MRGREAARAYWAGQWAEPDPRAEPVRVTAAPDGAVVADVHQAVRDRAGTVLLDRMVCHVYRLRARQVTRMDIAEAGG